MKYISLLLLYQISLQAIAQAEMWDEIKTDASPEMAAAFVSLYAAPELLPLADYGWEDGLQVSSNGLYLYTLYAPADLLSWFNFINDNPGLPICETLGSTAFLRDYANDYGMDMATNYFGCDSGINIDVLYAERESLDHPFTSWNLSDMALAGTIEGGPFPLVNPTNPLQTDIFLFTGPGDIRMIRGTGANPSGTATAEILPEPINDATGTYISDNPVLHRYGESDTLLLIYEKYIAGNPRDFMYAFSYDFGESWQEPVTITTVNHDAGHIEHPQLVYLHNSYYLYYSFNYDIYRSRQAVSNDWDSWTDPEAVILKNNCIALGEPSVLSNGDIFFLAGYMSDNPDDQFDLDPWLARSLESVSVTETAPERISLYPNPVETYLNIASPNLTEPVQADLLSIDGQLLQTWLLTEKHQTIDVQMLLAGTYLLRCSNGFSTLLIKSDTARK